MGDYLDDLAAAGDPEAIAELKKRAFRKRLLDIDLWCCENCGWPCIIEDGGFAPNETRVTAGQERSDSHLCHIDSDKFIPTWLSCGLCGDETFIKVTFEPKYS